MSRIDDIRLGASPPLPTYPAFYPVPRSIPYSLRIYNRLRSIPSLYHISTILPDHVMTLSELKALYANAIGNPSRSVYELYLASGERWRKIMEARVLGGASLAPVVIGLIGAHVLAGVCVWWFSGEGKGEKDGAEAVVKGTRVEVEMMLLDWSTASEGGRTERSEGSRRSKGSESEGEADTQDEETSPLHDLEDIPLLTFSGGTPRGDGAIVHDDARVDEAKGGDHQLPRHLGSPSSPKLLARRTSFSASSCSSATDSEREAILFHKDMAGELGEGCYRLRSHLSKSPFTHAGSTDMAHGFDDLNQSAAANGGGHNVASPTLLSTTDVYIAPHLILMRYVHPNTSLWPPYYLHVFLAAEKAGRGARSAEELKLSLSWSQVEKDLADGIVGLRAGVYIDDRLNWPGIRWLGEDGEDENDMVAKQGRSSANHVAETRSVAHYHQ